MVKINKKAFLFCLAVLFICLGISGCQNPFLQLDNASESSYSDGKSSLDATPLGSGFHTVSFITKWGSVAQLTGIIPGSFIDEPDSLTKEYYMVEGWYKDSAFTDRWDFASHTVDSNITLHAKWVVVQGDGSPGDPFLVYDADTLKAVGRGIMESKGQKWNLDKCYKQIEDVDLTGEGNWLPIGSGTNYFEGTYNGSGYVISNLSCISSSRFTGLFARIGQEAKIMSLGLENIYIDNSNNSYSGGIAGYGEAGSSIMYCHVSGVIKGMSFIGGIIGSTTGSVDCSYTSCDIIGEYIGYYFGGITGYQLTGAVSNCYAVGNISGGQCVGGIVGMGNLVQNCYATGKVSSEVGVGGIMCNVASLSAEIINCVALNSSIEASSDTGRICCEETNIVFANNYARSGIPGFSQGALDDKDGLEITGDYYNTQAWWIDEETWAPDAWDFGTIWKWDWNKNLPVLAWEGA